MLDEYIKAKGWKPLTDKEITKGKNDLRIYGTQTPMPWNTIFTRIASGQDFDEIGKQYGHARKIFLFAQLAGVKPDPVVQELVEEEVAHRKRLVAVANETSDEIAQTILQRANELFPDFQTNVAQFADKLIHKASAKLDDPYIESSDFLNLAKAVQTVTDTTGHTQRHASAASITTNNIKVDGFEFVLDAPQPQQEGAIDVQEVD